ncbi:uncharacterized protein LOC122119470 [Dipodomys spectabilis]|uniref:uncharacterized protein LOC122119470 n=1 Tax=Dipodomys spectabilis TaxID=105255 RepID=UPI001C5383D3|nr:uncharacterized protein LOC122119470 [Dipodomys spectabilis]
MSHSGCWPSFPSGPALQLYGGPIYGPSKTHIHTSQTLERPRRGGLRVEDSASLWGTHKPSAEGLSVAGSLGPHRSTAASKRQTPEQQGCPTPHGDTERQLGRVNSKERKEGNRVPVISWSRKSYTLEVNDRYYSKRGVAQGRLKTHVSAHSRHISAAHPGRSVASQALGCSDAARAPPCLAAPHFLSRGEWETQETVTGCEPEIVCRFRLLLGFFLSITEGRVPRG